MQPVKDELKRMVKLGIIEPITKPTRWCAPVVPVPKKNDEIRLVGDFLELNKEILREKLDLPSVEETLNKRSKASIFTKHDANQGFFHIKMDSKSLELT